MSTLMLDTSLKAILTRTDTVPNPAVAGGTMLSSYPCDIKGNRLPQDQALPIYRDQITGNTFVKLLEKIPSGQTQPANSVHYVSPDGSVVGYFVPAPDFNNRERQVPKAAAAPEVAGTGVQAPRPVPVNT